MSTTNSNELQQSKSMETSFESKDKKKNINNESNKNSRQILDPIEDDGKDPEYYRERLKMWQHIWDTKVANH